MDNFLDLELVDDELTRPVNPVWSRLAVAMLVVVIMVNVISAVSYFVLISDLSDLWNRETETLDNFRLTGTLIYYLTPIQGGVILLTGLAFVNWSFQLHRSVVAGKFSNLVYRSVWAIIGWLVPVMCFYVPYRIMNENWYGAVILGRPKDDPNRFQVPPNRIVGWWWSLFLISSVMAGFGLWLIFQADTFDSVLAAAMLKCAADFLWALSAFMAIRLMGDINRALQGEVEEE